MSDGCEREEAFRKTTDLVQNKKYDEAINYCRGNIAHWDASDQHHAWGDLAYALSQAQRSQEALQAASRAVELAPEDRRHRFRRAMMATELQVHELALEDWSELIQLEDAEKSIAFLGAARLGRALVLIQLQSFTEAMRDLAEVSADEAIFIRGELKTAGALKELVNSKLRDT